MNECRKYSDKLKKIKEMCKVYPTYFYRNQLNQYIESHFSNILDNTPELILERLKVFFPDMRILIKRIERMQ